MVKIFNFIIIVTISALFTSCSSNNLITKPRPYGLNKNIKGSAPEGSETFQSGWSDGCTTGLAAYGSLHYKASYDFTYNDNMLDNDEYHNAWRIGFRHCRWYVATWLG